MKTIEQLAASLTGRELMELIHHRKDDIIIYAGLDGNRCRTPEILSVCMNGNFPQLNLGPEPSSSALLPWKGMNREI